MNEVKKEMLQIVLNLQARFIKRSITNEEDEVGEKRKGNEVDVVGSSSNSKDIFKKGRFG